MIVIWVFDGFSIYAYKVIMQVEDLTRKSQLLEAEVEKTSKQLKHVTAIAENEAENCKSAKEVIRSLTAQVGFSAHSFTLQIKPFRKID